MRIKHILDEKGSQTIEFLMILPAILVLVLCLGEFGRVAHAKILLQAAVREGARTAAVQAPKAEVRRVMERSLGNLALAELEITRETTIQRGPSGNSVKPVRQQQFMPLAQPVYLEDMAIRAVCLVPLTGLMKLGLPAQFGQARIEVVTRVPVLESSAK